MELLVHWMSLTGYESALVGALFVSGNVTDTEKIGNSTSNRGFDPASILKGPLKQRRTASSELECGAEGFTQARAAPSPSVAGRSRAWSTLVDRIGVLYVLAPIAVSGILYVIGFMALTYRKRVDFGSFPTRLPSSCRRRRSPPWPLRSFTRTPAEMCSGSRRIRVFRPRAPDEPLQRGQVPRRLSRASSFARSSLRPGHTSSRAFERSPHLDDKWFPYLVALSWTGRRSMVPFLRRRERESPTSVGSSGSSLRGGESSSRPWTGGGAFGGAGGTGSWAAGGVRASPRASRHRPRAPAAESGGGGGGGGGVRGGGGGGGW